MKIQESVRSLAGYQPEVALSRIEIDRGESIWLSEIIGSLIQAAELGHVSLAEFESFNDDRRTTPLQVDCTVNEQSRRLLNNGQKTFTFTDLGQVDVLSRAITWGALDAPEGEDKGELRPIIKEGAIELYKTIEAAKLIGQRSLSCLVEHSGRRRIARRFSKPSLDQRVVVDVFEPVGPPAATVTVDPRIKTANKKISQRS